MGVGVLVCFVRPMFVYRERTSVDATMEKKTMY